MEYVKRKEALEVLGICYKTLYKIADNKEIDTAKLGSNTVYNVNKYLRDHNISKINKKKICYCRVSSHKQKEDLERQINYMKKAYPYHEIITDIASGLNYEREGLKKLIRYALKGEISEVVIAYKDRLTRFGYELIEWLIKENSNGVIKIINNQEETTPMEEVSKDIIAIMNVYVAKINGLRKYKKQIKAELKLN